MSDTTVRLQYPIQAHGEEVTELTVRRPRVKDLRAMDAAAGDVSKTAVLIGGLCALTPKEVDSLDAEDFAALGQVVAGFLSAVQPTGGI